MIFFSDQKSSFFTVLAYFWPPGPSKSSPGYSICWEIFDPQLLGTVLDLIRAKIVILLVFSRISALKKHLGFHTFRNVFFDFFDPFLDPQG